METTTIILLVAAVAIVFIIYLRFFKKEKDPIMPGKDPRKDEYYDLPADESTFEFEEEQKEQDIPKEEPSRIETDEEIEEANKEYDIPEVEMTRIIPDEEIEQYSDEHEKAMVRINNYFISNGYKNLTGRDFFDIQENILLDSDSDHDDLYSDIHQIFQITDNRLIAITDLTAIKKQVNDQKNNTLKGILGIIICRNSIGKGRIVLYQNKEEDDDENEFKEENLVANLFNPEADTRIGRYILHYEGTADKSAIESLCNELDKLQMDHVVYINRNSAYIRINRPARLDDLTTMIEILMNFKH